MKSSQDSRLVTQSRGLWVALFLLFAAVMILTMLKDLWLTTEEPNASFYIFVPILSILGGVLCMYGVSRVSGQTITFLTLFVISLGTNTLMQIVENAAKIIYYLVWEYPGFLYIVFVIPLGFLFLGYGLVRWGKVSRRMAVILAMFDFVGSMVLAILLTDVIGLTTPGS